MGKESKNPGGFVELDRCSRVGSVSQNQGAPSGSSVQTLVLLGRERSRRESDAPRYRQWKEAPLLLAELREVTVPQQSRETEGLAFQWAGFPSSSDFPGPGPRIL